jgi:hypothetical protein
MKSATVAGKGVIAQKCAIRTLFLCSSSALRAADWEKKVGYTPHADRKSAEAVENK